MRFINEKNFKEVSLEEGLKLIEENHNRKLYSDGLESDEYICHMRWKGFCYEDGCMIGDTSNKVIENLTRLKWATCHKFYISD